MRRKKNSRQTKKVKKSCAKDKKNRARKIVAPKAKKVRQRKKRRAKQTEVASEKKVAPKEKSYAKGKNIHHQQDVYYARVCGTNRAPYKCHKRILSSGSAV